MDCRLNDKIKAMVENLAREHQQELAEAGTLVDLEELTCQIGDEVAQQLCQHELLGRAELAMKEEIAKCPECGEPCMVGPPEPAVLRGLRGELAYSQPSYHCRDPSARSRCYENERGRCCRGSPARLDLARGPRVHVASDIDFRSRHRRVS